MKLWAIGLSAALLAGCSMKEDMTAIDAAVTQFHYRLDAGTATTILQASAPEMKAAPSAGMLIPILEAVHRKLGRVVGTQRRGFNDVSATGGHFCTATYHTRFERGEGDESFNFKLVDGRPMLAGYNVTSPALILN